MEQILNWTKGMFDSNYQIFSHGQIKGSLLFSSWENSARGISIEKNYEFKTSGFSSPKTQILTEKGEIIGTISYDLFRFKAILNLASDEQFTWSFTNNWLNQWLITDYKDKQIYYNSSTSSGFIQSNTTDEVMLLSGLFIREYYARVLILFLIIVFLPLLMRGVLN